MRQALHPNPQRSRVAGGVSLPASVDGWDTASPLAAMPPTCAVILDNLIPRAGYTEARRGHVPWATGMTDPVETLMTWEGAAGGKLFAAAGSAFWDVTTSGTATTTSVTSLSFSRWQSTNIANAGGQFLVCVDGVDDGRRFDGTAWTSFTITSSITVFSTLASAKVDNVMTHKKRLFFAMKDSLNVFYTPPDTLAGPCGYLPLGGQFREGGRLVAMGSWTVDGGTGPDDYAVFITNHGEIAIYTGTDPSDASNWSIVGTFKIGLPLGPRCLCKYGGDLVIMCSDGALPLSQLLATNFTRPQQVALTAKIAPTFSAAAQLYKDNFGWEAVNYTVGSILIFNVPQVELGRSVQFVQSLITGGWCQFKGLNAWCWGIVDGDIYFGGNGAVFKFDVGSQDNGMPIMLENKTAFNYLDAPGVEKHVNMVRPVVKLSSSLTTRPSVIVDADFRNKVPIGSPSVVGTEDGRWDIGLWGAAVWGATDQVNTDWTGATAIGYAVAAHLLFTISSVNAEIVQIISYDLNAQMGGRL